MSGFFQTINDFIQSFFHIVDTHLSRVSPDASAILLALFGLGLIVLLAIIALRLIPGEKQAAEYPKRATVDLDDIDGNAKLKRVIRELTEENDEYRTRLREYRLNPDHSTVEKMYFSVNGITNSGLLLSIGLLLWEFFNLRNRNGAIQISSITDELGRMMSVLALTMAFSAVVVFIARPEKGRSYERTNKAFFISLVFSAAAMIVFSFMSKHSL
jgi:cbb3-type cytochrome oxidase subunit 3